MQTLPVLYFIEPMMGLGSHYWAQVLAKAIVERHKNIELTVLIDDLVPFNLTHERIHWVKLPVCRNQVKADGSLGFKLIDSEGKEVDEAWKQKRVDIVTSTFKQTKPNVVLLHNHLSGLEWDYLIEFEYKQVVDLAHFSAWKPPVLATAMDFIDGFEDASELTEVTYLQKVKEEVDHILVCGDNLDLFIHSCPPARHFKDKLVLAGYPIDSNPILPLSCPPASPEVLVAAGGSELGEPLFRAAIEAFALAHRQGNSELSQYPWRLLVGPHLKDKLPMLQALAKQVAESVGAEPLLMVQPSVSSTEYLSRLTHHCVASLSQCGQSTFVDLERSGVPALVVPYEANGTVQEQLYRAQFLQNAKRGVLLREQNLTPEALLTGLENALAIGPKRIGVDLNGAPFVAQFIHDLAVQNHQAQYTASDNVVPFLQDDELVPAV